MRAGTLTLSHYALVSDILNRKLQEEETTARERESDRNDEPTCRCHQNPFIGALGIHQPVILREPQIIKDSKELARVSIPFPSRIFNHLQSKVMLENLLSFSIILSIFHALSFFQSLFS